MRDAGKARRLLQADAAFEVVLGLPLASAPATGLDRRLGLPAPTAAVARFGAVLLPFAGVPLHEARAPRRERLAALAAVNATAAALGGAWLAAARSRFGGGGQAVVGATVGALGALAAAQAVSAARG